MERTLSYQLSTKAILPPTKANRASRTKVVATMEHDWQQYLQGNIARPPTYPQYARIFGYSPRTIYTYAQTAQLPNRGSTMKRLKDPEVNRANSLKRSPTQRREDGLKGYKAIKDRDHVADGKKAQALRSPAERSFYGAHAARHPKRYRCEHEGMMYGSAREAVTADHLKNRLQYSWQPVENSTTQVKIDGEAGSMIADFVITNDAGEKVIVEMHPTILFGVIGYFKQKKDYKIYRWLGDVLEEAAYRELTAGLEEGVSLVYLHDRNEKVDGSAFQAAEVIVVQNYRELYKKVMIRFGKDCPDTEEALTQFVKESRLLERKIRKQNRRLQNNTNPQVLPVPEELLLAL